MSNYFIVSYITVVISFILVLRLASKSFILYSLISTDKHFNSDPSICFFESAIFSITANWDTVQPKVFLHSKIFATIRLCCFKISSIKESKSLWAENYSADLNKLSSFKPNVLQFWCNSWHLQFLFAHLKANWLHYVQADSAALFSIQTLWCFSIYCDAIDYYRINEISSIYTSYQNKIIVFLMTM